MTKDYVFTAAQHSKTRLWHIVCQRPDGKRVIYEHGWKTSAEVRDMTAWLARTIFDTEMFDRTKPNA